MLQAHRHSKNLEASTGQLGWECDLSIDLNSLLTGRIIALSHGWRLDVSGPYLSYSATRTWPQSKRSLGCVWLELSTGGLIVSRCIRKSFSRCCILLVFLFWLRSVCVCVCACARFSFCCGCVVVFVLVLVLALVLILVLVLVPVVLVAVSVKGVGITTPKKICML